MRRALLLLLALTVTVTGCASGSAAHRAAHSTLFASARAVSPYPSLRPPVPVPVSSSTSVPPVPATTSSPPARARTTHSPVPATLPRQSPAGTGPLVVLDPGHHGGNGSHLSQINRLVPAGFGRMKPCNTTGTESNAGYPEHAFTWDVALRVRAILAAHGLRVIMTRTDDSGWGPCVNERAAIESTPGTVAAVAIHADGAPSAGHGFHVCYDSRVPDGASAATLARSRSLSTAVHDALSSTSGLTPSTYIGSDGYYPRDDMAGLNLSSSPTTFLELGNMRNGPDAARQSSAAGRARIAAAIAAGILAYLAAHPAR